MVEPSDEIKQALSSIESNLRQLRSFVDEFEAALNTFDEAGYHSDAVGRMFMSAKSGAIIVFNIGKIISYTGGQLRSFPHIDALIDHKELRSARKMFERAFPYFLESRHAVAHAGESMSTPSQLHKHAVKTGVYSTRGTLATGELIMVSANLEGRTLHSTWAGQAVSYEISSASLEVLRTVYDMFHEGLSKLPSSYGYRGE